MNKSEHYSTLRIRKKNGSFRQLYNPDGYIRSVQSSILHRVFSKISIPEYIFAFEKKKSIPEMAKVHVGKRLVISIDLKDFFTTITHRIIVKVLMDLGASESAAKTLAELCTYKFFVPQGGLTSPKISNIVTSRTFGPEVNSYCLEQGLDLTIYADDITMSTSKEGHIDVEKIINDIKGIITTHGFRVNFSKTKVMWKKSRQYVCGVVVNNKTNLLKKQRQKLRAIVYNVQKNGLEAEAAKNNLAAGEFESHLKGKLNWFAQLNPELGSKLKDKFDLYLKDRKPDVLDMIKEREVTDTYLEPPWA